MALSATLQERGIGLELLTGALTGIYDPHGLGAMLFAVLAVGAELDRNYIREKALEGQQAAAAKGNHGGRPKVIDDDMLLFARALRDRGTPMLEITKKLVIKTGKTPGGTPLSPRSTAPSPTPTQPDRPPSPTGGRCHRSYRHPRYARPSSAAPR